MTARPPTRATGRRAPVEAPASRSTSRSGAASCGACVGHVRAVDGVDFAIAPGQTLGLVGESGSGKSTLGRCSLRLLDPTGGDAHVRRRDVTKLADAQIRERRRGMQMVFQDPYSSFDPLATIAESMAEPMRSYLELDASGRDERVAELLRTGRPRAPSTAPVPARVLRRPAAAHRDRARARARPEAGGARRAGELLDVSTQAQVINLLGDLQDGLGLAYLFIAHDLAVVRHVSDRIAVMYLGRIVEQGPAEEVYTRPKHPYTEALLSAIPVPDPARQRGREPHRARGRHPVARRPALRLPLPHPLPVRDGRVPRSIPSRS